MNPDTYFTRKEVSNSDLSKVAQLMQKADYIADATAAYRFGALVDAIITEPDRVNEFRFKVDEEQYTREEFEIARAMRRSFVKDPLFNSIKPMATFQQVSTAELQIEYQGFQFTLPARCKWDLFMQMLRHGGDIKSTTATSLKQFHDAVEYFDYDRQRAWYMDIVGAEKDILFGISKKEPHSVFKIAITRDSEIYKRGKEKYQELAFRYWCLFHDINN